MAKVENDLDICNAVGNTNTQRKEKKTSLQKFCKSVILMYGSWSQQVPQY